MMTIDEFAAAVGVDQPLLADAYQAFCEESGVPRKTRAARCADLADGLRRLGIPEDVVYTAVSELARARR